MRDSYETNAVGNRLYAMDIVKLNAADYGVPQNRRRVFVIGVSVNAGGEGVLHSIMKAIGERLIAFDIVVLFTVK